MTAAATPPTGSTSPVKDPRAVGDSKPRAVEYKCPRKPCRVTRWSETIPECPDHKCKMVKK